MTTAVTTSNPTIIPQFNAIESKTVFDLGYLGGTRKHIMGYQTKLGNRLNLEPARILALRKIFPQIVVLAYQKKAQPSH
jgi:hypothetical protein